MSDNERSLLGLPNELLDIVAKHLDVSSKSALTKTCKAMHERGIKNLYSDIDLEFPGISDVFPKVVLLLCRLIEEPELAGYVKSIDVKADNLGPISGRWASRWETPSGRHSQLSGAVASLLSHIRQLNVASAWEEAILRQDGRAIIAMFIWFSPNLEVLKVGMGLTWCNKFLENVLLNQGLGGRVGSAFPLQKLRCVSIGDSESWTPSGGTPFPVWALFLQSPPLQKLEIHSGSPGFNREYLESHILANVATPHYTDNMSGLNTLRITKSTISPKNLELILSFLPRLAKLEYSYNTSRDDYTPKGGEIRLAELEKVLSHVKDVLTDLRLSFCTSVKFRDPDEREVSGRCSFREFSMASLQVSCTTLLGLSSRRTESSIRATYFQESASVFWNAIPTTIERLVILEDFLDPLHRGTGMMWKELEDFVLFLPHVFNYPGWRALVPHLKQMDFDLPCYRKCHMKYEALCRIDQPYECIYQCSQYFEAIRQACVDNGLECRFVDLDDEW